MNTTTSTEVLAERYATLKLQAKKIDDQLKQVSEELLKELKPGHAVVTHEYRLACNPGRATFTFICSKNEEKQFKEELIKRGLADMKVGNPYVQLSWIKSGADDE